MSKHKEPPEEIEEPPEVIFFKKGWENWEIAKTLGISEKEVSNNIITYYTRASKKYVFELGERNVKILLEVMNIKTPDNE